MYYDINNLTADALLLRSLKVATARFSYATFSTLYTNRIKIKIFTSLPGCSTRATQTLFTKGGVLLIYP
jgi:hypothetical protein